MFCLSSFKIEFLIIINVYNNFIQLHQNQVRFNNYCLHLLGFDKSLAKTDGHTNQFWQMDGSRDQKSSLGRLLSFLQIRTDGYLRFPLVWLAPGFHQESNV